MTRSKEAGKGSKQRPLSITRKQFSNNWDKIFTSSTPGKYKNTVDQEVWLCENFFDITSIDGVEYVKVFKEELPNRRLLIRKDTLKKVGVD